MNVDHPGMDRDAPIAPQSPMDRTAVVIGLGFLVSLAFCWPRIVDIWATGNYYDSDDAMRMVEVRDLLRGQGWYDLTQWRLDPPAGSLMHWSRVVDIPLSLLIWTFRMIASPDLAERLARIVFPLGLQVGLLAVTACAARVLLGKRGIAPAIALSVLSGFMFGQFVPGRIDHHAPQIVLLMAIVASMAAAMDPGRERWVAVTAAAIAVSLEISVENLLFILVACATPPLMWIHRGRESRPLLLWFSGGLAVTIPLVILAFKAPALWFVPACDAFSPVYATIVLAAAALSAVLATLDILDGTRSRRCLAAATLGAIIGAPVLVFSTHCLLDPFGGLDPLVRDIWLNNVGEARPALKHFAIYPEDIQTIGFPVMIGLGGLLAAVLQTSGLSRERFLYVLAQTLAGCIAATFMIRVATFIVPLVLLGAAWLALCIGGLLPRELLSGRMKSVIAILATVPMSTVGWAMAPPLISARAKTDSKDYRACLAATSLAPLAKLPKGLVLASIEEGAFILVETPHSVISASYHRNNHGNRIAIDAFRSSPDDARDIIRANGVEYVFVCDGAKELTIIAARWPEGLAAQLLQGQPFDWLTPVAMTGTPYRAFSVK